MYHLVFQLYSRENYKWLRLNFFFMIEQRLHLSLIHKKTATLTCGGFGK